MSDLRFYLSLFRRRLPWFLVVATILSAVAVTVAFTLPPAYESRMVLLVESAQIPEDLASSTVQTPAFEQLQIVQQRLMTRNNLLDIARRQNVLLGQEDMNPDQIVEAMRARTTIRTTSGREAPLMTITFEAPSARTSAEVLNDYLVLIQQQDTEFRKGRSGETLAFFTQEVKRLGDELAAQSARILEYKQQNADALPDSLTFRLNEKSELQDRLTETDRDIASLQSQRERLIQLFDLTGGGATQAGLVSPEEEQLLALKEQLASALIVYSPENPRIRQLQARIEQLEASLPKAGNAAEEGEKPVPVALTIQLADIDSRIALLEEDKATFQAELDAVNATLKRSPEVSIALEDLERSYEMILNQYNLAEERLSKASTGDRIETRSRGQRIVVVEQPAVPSQPTKPNRIKIAGGGVFLGIAAGLGLIVLLEMLNTTARRPEDIVSRLGVTPITTIPYIRTRAQKFRQRSAMLALILVILVGIPAAVFAVHTYYLPLDLLADKVMNRMGVRW
jgi:polysaccharide chain length determinant protein (PEP-CTERM system associated)